MLLRTRLILIVLVFSVVLTGGLVLAAFERERLNDVRYARAVLSGYQSLWAAVLESTLERMDTEVPDFTNVPVISSALDSGDSGLISTVFNSVADALIMRGSISRFEVLNRHGGLAFTSQASLFPSPILDGSQAERVLAGERVRGLAQDAGRTVFVADSQPLQDRGRVVGILTVARAVDTVLARMQHETGDDVFVVNRRGRMLAGTTPPLWDALVAGHVVDPGVDSLRIVPLNERRLSMATLPLGTGQGAQGALAGNLVIVKDVTESERRQDQVAQVTLIAVGAFLVLMITTLGWYMRTSFLPLEAALGVLQALTEGDTRRSVEGVDRADEIGNLARALEVLRRRQMTLERLKRSRTRQRHRQERFIRQEMTSLAQTLEDEAREDILADLAEIEAEASRVLTRAQRAGEDGDVAETSGLGMMAPAIQKMASRVREQHGRLREVIAELREALATKTAYLSLQRELGIAHDMQLSILPKGFPPRPEMDLHGSMRPAKEVGGDFYDFFAIDADRVGVVVADVSGKGVPAAFFMAIARTLLKATALFGERPGTCLAKLNDLLCETNDQELFVTVFYGLYHVRDGHMVYANGGHNPPLCLRADGRVEPLPLTGGTALAVLDGLSYVEATVTLGEGDSLFLYTDGVTEAFNPAGVEFGEERLTALLSGLGDLDARTLNDRAMAAVAAFAEDEPQADDITCVTLRRLRA
ncbi:PP2C family protein-serine/threonine phosphatase [Roseospira visakhapatnamensis]|uniref:Sigma-B regulation protein RsbU (Phosphoserine phosphatase) n=1 Tax=Roseospira visakhapatnamensis TaxID=390880 RepID=A0A7W6RAC1_9PROT|nr:SpoIIE family protein phosphatase [Roseospira visakhapatnamensis]MBB4264750.1 sigma-B regulation protein RsbU (phosphoserine phosphatase) [Roseospira visakhapatnamensis]